MLNFFLNTVSFPVMNLSINLYLESDLQKTKDFIDYQKNIRKQQLLSVVRSKPYQHTFAPHHYIQPRREIANEH